MPRFMFNGEEITVTNPEQKAISLHRVEHVPDCIRHNREHHGITDADPEGYLPDCQCESLGGLILHVRRIMLKGEALLMHDYQAVYTYDNAGEHKEVWEAWLGNIQNLGMTN